MAALFTSLAGVAAISASAAEPQAPVITNPFDGVVFHDVPYIDGTGEPGSTAAITDGNGTPVCSAPIDEFGNFSCVGTERLPAGGNELTVTSTTPGGAETVGNTVQVWGVYYPSVSYPEPGSLISTNQSFSGVALPDAEVSLLDAAGGTVCRTVSDEWGDFACTPEVSFPAGPLTLTPTMATAGGEAVVGDSVTWSVIAAPVITSPKNGDMVGTLPVFSGTGFPGADISVLHGRSGAVLCSAKVSAEGTFTCAMTQPVVVGELWAVPMISVDGEGSVMGAIVTLTVEAAQESPAPSSAPTSAAPSSAAPTETPTTAPGTPPTSAPTSASAGPGAGTSQHLAATGAGGIAAPAAVGALMLLGGAAALLPRFRRRARH